VTHLNHFQRIYKAYLFYIIMVVFTLCLFLILNRWLPISKEFPLNITSIEKQHNISFPVIVFREMEPWEF